MSGEAISILAILLGFVLLIGLLFYLWAARFLPELPGPLAVLTGALLHKWGFRGFIP